MSRTRDLFTRDELDFKIAPLLRERARECDKNAEAARQIAVALRAGGKVPMFADGETGARAADGLAAQHDYQAKTYDDLAERVDKHLAHER